MSLGGTVVADEASARLSICRGDTGSPGWFQTGRPLVVYGDRSKHDMPISFYGLLMTLGAPSRRIDALVRVDQGACRDQENNPQQKQGPTFFQNPLLDLFSTLPQQEHCLFKSHRKKSFFCLCSGVHCRAVAMGRGQLPGRRGHSAPLAWALTRGVDNRWLQSGPDVFSLWARGRWAGAAQGRSRKPSSGPE